MMKRTRRLRPSYANVTATVALALALGVGGAYAAGKIGSADIAKNAVKSKHVKNGQVKTPDLAANVAVNSAKTAGSATTADRANNVIAASVANGCTTVNGGTGAVSVAPDGGECNVTFPRSVANCAIVLGTLFDSPGGGETTYRKTGDTTVQVSRRDSAGGTPTAGAFSIAAICP